MVRFTTTTTPRRISYVGIHRISTGAEKILLQFSFNDGTDRKALSLTVMITMAITMNDDNDTGNNDGEDYGGDDGNDGNIGDEDDDDSNDDGSDSDNGNNHDGGNNKAMATR